MFGNKTRFVGAELLLNSLCHLIVYDGLCTRALFLPVTVK